MRIVDCDVPSSSVLGRELIDKSYFHDCHRAPLIRADLGMVDIFFAVFGHLPLWMKSLLIVRNAVAGRIGLKAPTVAEIMHPASRKVYGVGDKIGRWTVFSIGDNEIVSGGNDKHLDFRVSVLKEADGNTASVVVSTVCTVHNLFGKIYLFIIVPFHRIGVRSLMRRAVAAKRL